MQTGSSAVLRLGIFTGMLLGLASVARPADAADLLVERFESGRPAGWAVGFNGTGPMPTPTPTTENGLGPGGCSDGIDNDGDSRIDCGDSDCVGVPPCVAPAPAVPWPLAALVLLLVGWLGLTKRARR